MMAAALIVVGELRKIKLSYKNGSPNAIFYTNVTNIWLDLLIDTGCAKSVLANDRLKPGILPKGPREDILGVSGAASKTYGNVDVKLAHNGKYVKTNFEIIDRSLLNLDGVVGMNVIRKYKWVIDTKKAYIYYDF